MGQSRSAGETPRSDIEPAKDSAIETWRLIPIEASDGPTNMAIDEALLKRVGEGLSPPTLRFYEWRTPWVSLGSGQPWGDLDRSVSHARGWQLVRRSSGGTAVLHEGQLGYSLVLPTTHHVWEGDLVDSYRRLAEPIQRGLARLGVTTDQASEARRAELVAATPALAKRVCFAALGPHELRVNGRKIVGNSQVRRRLASVQHGVIQLTGSQSMLSRVLAGATDRERAAAHDFLELHVGAIAATPQRLVTASALAESLAGALAETFDVSLEPGHLTFDESILTDELVVTKFGDPAWTFRR